MAVVCISECDRKKVGARVGTARPSASDGRQEVYLGTGAEVNQTRDRLKGGFTTPYKSKLTSQGSCADPTKRQVANKKTGLTN